jgi:hypothetical protein
VSFPIVSSKLSTFLMVFDLCSFSNVNSCFTIEYISMHDGFCEFVAFFNSTACMYN